ncbi:MAG: hypothetical protein ACRD3T_06885 [Terriglobia bacterium]
MATKTLLTIEEFVPLLEARDVRYELVEGERVAQTSGFQEVCGLFEIPAKKPQSF